MRNVLNCIKQSKINKPVKLCSNDAKFCGILTGNRGLRKADGRTEAELIQLACAPARTAITSGAYSCWKKMRGWSLKRPSARKQSTGY